MDFSDNCKWRSNAPFSKSIQRKWYKRLNNMNNVMKLGYFIFSRVWCHSNMITPTPRGNVQWFGYCSRGQGCITTCDSPKSESKINDQYNQPQVVKRGDKISIEWLRQNHPGGFIRLSMTQFELSDDQASFNNNVVKYVCYETNCKEDSEDVNLGNLNGHGNNKCSTDFQIPNNLPDGPITLQWTWFGGGIYFGQQDTVFANYVSCADMVLQGGQEYTQEQLSPIFQGGDSANPSSNQCRYWGANRAESCPEGFETSQTCGQSVVLNGAPDGM